MTDLLFTGILIYAAMYDIRHHKIPGYVAAVILSIVMITWLMSAGGSEMTEKSYFVEIFAGAMVPAGVMMLIDIIRPGAFGGGDIKLTAAAGMYLGWQRMIASGIVTVMTAGISCMIMLLTGKIKVKTKVAFGPYLTAGMISGLFWGEKIFRWLCS